MTTNVDRPDHLDLERNHVGADHGAGRGPQHDDASTAPCTASRSRPASPSATRRAPRAAAAPTRRWPRPGTARPSPTCTRRSLPGSAIALFNGLSCVSAHSCAVVGGGYTGDTGNSLARLRRSVERQDLDRHQVERPQGRHHRGAERRVLHLSRPLHRRRRPRHRQVRRARGARLERQQVDGAQGGRPGTGKAAAFEAISCPVNGKCVTTGATGKADWLHGHRRSPATGTAAHGSTARCSRPLPLDRQLSRSYLQNGCVVPLTGEATHPFCVPGGVSCTRAGRREARPRALPEVEQRSLSVYDALAGGGEGSSLMASQTAKKSDLDAEIAFLTRALKAPALPGSATDHSSRLRATAGYVGWLLHQGQSGYSHCGAIRPAGFPRQSGCCGRAGGWCSTPSASWPPCAVGNRPGQPAGYCSARSGWHARW